MIQFPCALVSDLHANLEATRAVWRDIDRQSTGALVCLGDIVGYGPDPAAVIDLVRARGATSVAGNHDWALQHGAFGFSPAAREALDYTRSLLRPVSWQRFGRTWKRWRYLQELPPRIDEGALSFVHGSLRDPLFDYCFGDRSSRWNPHQVEEIFEQVRWISFAGHTHFPVVIRDDKVCWYPSDSEPVLDLLPERKYIVNVGSVGQPRDGDPRACYALFDGQSIRYRRVRYDVKKTLHKIEQIPALEHRLGERLLVGQ